MAKYSLSFRTSLKPIKSDAQSDGMSESNESDDDLNLESKIVENQMESEEDSQPNDHKDYEHSEK